MLRSYRDLEVWQKAMDLVVNSYRVTAQFPSHERYGLTAQLRRAAVSVPANIAEGHGREHLREYLHFLSTANGSLMELETHILIGSRMTYIGADDEKTILTRTAEVGRMLAGLIRALKRRVPDTQHPTPGTYSVRSATIGSTPAARRAGNQLATSATPPSASATPANVTGS